VINVYPAEMDCPVPCTELAAKAAKPGSTRASDPHTRTSVSVSASALCNNSIAGVTRYVGTYAVPIAASAKPGAVVKRAAIEELLAG
jgi:hypothetical protein